ncbi:hypothetical protein [Allofournierella massiliensis]|uniref:hypothetical protein n=1 Tax=Allofournierella massiliensis TaxID=1650663 RepID=UPI0024B24457|nr:hypothetical protein [Fournierella massiliensis]
MPEQLACSRAFPELKEPHAKSCFKVFETLAREIDFLRKNCGNRSTGNCQKELSIVLTYAIIQLETLLFAIILFATIQESCPPAAYIVIPGYGRFGKDWNESSQRILSAFPHKLPSYTFKAVQSPHVTLDEWKEGTAHGKKHKKGHQIAAGGPANHSL